jgi:hypothetical protein
LGSGCLARVKMMQPADFWNLDHKAKRGRLDRSADGCILFERHMRAAPFVVYKIILQDPTQPGLMENDNVIQAFAPDGTDESFGVGILPRTLRCRQDFVDAHPFWPPQRTCPHNSGRGRAAGTVAPGPKGKLREVDAPSILRLGERSQQNESDVSGYGRESRRRIGAGTQSLERRRNLLRPSPWRDS